LYLKLYLIEYYYGDILRDTYCSKPCATMSIQFGQLINDNNMNNEGLVRMYYNSDIQIQQSIMAYSVLSLLAEVGGYVGLLLGVSFLDIAKILERLLFKK
jgi:hypothetical protein